jgi:hypothetical protein
MTKETRLASDIRGAVQRAENERTTVVFLGDARRVSEGFALALDAMAANQHLLMTGDALNAHEVPQDEP